MAANNTWIVIVRGESDGQDVRVALDFQDAESLPSRFVVGESFINQLMTLLQLNENWLVKTVIEEIKTPQKNNLPPGIPLFLLLTKSAPRGLSAGVLFIAEDMLFQFNKLTQSPLQLNNALLDTTKRFVVAGLSPVGFTAACKEDPKLFTRFISRLLKRPEAFAEVTLLLPRWYHPQT